MPDSDEIVRYVSTILDNLKAVGPSTDRLGRENWIAFGSVDRCWRCGGHFGADLEPGSEHRHHMIPRSEGGTNAPDNIALLCASCHAVVHKFYLPSSRIGRSRSRDGVHRIVGQFRDGTTISQILPREDFPLQECQTCGALGTVTGATEGYWNGEGLLVLLDCPDCPEGFAVPFIGTAQTPEIDPLSAICADFRSGLALLSQRSLPAEFEAEVKAFTEQLIDTLQECRVELNAAEMNARRSGQSEEAIAQLSSEIRNAYADRVRALLPEAERLTREGNRIATSDNSAGE